METKKYLLWRDHSTKPFPLFLLLNNITLKSMSCIKFMTLLRLFFHTDSSQRVGAIPPCFSSFEGKGHLGKYLPISPFPETQENSWETSPHSGWHISPKVGCLGALKLDVPMPYPWGSSSYKHVPNIDNRWNEWCRNTWYF